MRPTQYDDRATSDLITEFRRTHEEPLRREIIERHDRLIRKLAHKFARPGVSTDDLMQSAWIGLIRALDRFDPTRETLFSTYASHCAVGEIKRFFRDRTWTVRVPRRLQEISRNLPRVRDELCGELGREPTMAEMAQAFGITEDHVAQAMELQDVCRSPSMQDRLEGAGSSNESSVSDTIGQEDPALRSVVENAPLHAALSQLGPRDQVIMRRRYYEEWTQQEVASEMQVSQMHVSRLERSALRRLNTLLAGSS